MVSLIQDKVSIPASLVVTGEHEKECLVSFSASRPAAKGTLCRYYIPVVAASMLTTGAAALPTLSPDKVCVDGPTTSKDSVTACALVYADGQEPEVRRKEFATHVKALGMLRLRLFSQKVSHVAMESAGVYGKPVWQALEGHFALILANPFQIKTMPGRKTDAHDSQWIAELLAHGLIRPSFVPPPATRELRDLTRYRVKLTEERKRAHNRIHKVLEDACIKLDTVASDIPGASGRAMIQAIIDGQEHPDWLADKAKGRLRSKRPKLRLALRGRITNHHRLMLTELMEDLEFVERRIKRLDEQIAKKVDVETLARLATIPGIDLITAWTPVAELGSDMSVFHSPGHAAAWGGLCPGNHESGGKRLSNRTRKGNRRLRRALFCQSAWAATRKKNCYLRTFFFRKAGKHGIRKAIVATAHRLLVIAFCILRDKTEYRELGDNYFDRLHPERTRNRLLRRLERMGLDISVKLRIEPPPSLLPAPYPLNHPRKSRPCKCAERATPCKHVI